MIRFVSFFLFLRSYRLVRISVILIGFFFIYIILGLMFVWKSEGLGFLGRVLIKRRGRDEIKFFLFERCEEGIVFRIKI